MMSGVSRISIPWSSTGLVRSVAVAGVDLIPVDAAARPLGRREDAFDVDRAVRGCLTRIVDDDLAEVPLALERIGREDPDLDEMPEVAEVIEGRELVLGIDRQGVVVTASDLEQRRRAHRSFEVNV